MTFFGKLLSCVLPSAKPEPAAPPIVVPPVLPRLGQSGAADITNRAGLAPLASSRDNPAACLDALLKANQSVDAAAVLAYGLPERDAVQWASEACALAAEPSGAADLAAADAAKQWAAAPTHANHTAVTQAAALSGFEGPGAWAAQAAAWAAPAPASVTALAPVPSTPNPLVGKAVLGSVMLAAALSKPGMKLPAVPKLGLSQPAISSVPSAPSAPGMNADELTAIYRPFLEKGVAIAAKPLG